MFDRTFVLANSTEIGYSMLYIGGMLRVFVLSRKRAPARLYRLLAFVGAAYWLLWYQFGEGVVWYAYPGLIFGLLTVTSLSRILLNETSQGTGHLVKGS